MASRVVVEGQATLVATLHAAAARIRDTETPSRAVGSLIATRGRADAPVLSGRLASSVRSAADSDGAEVTSALAYANRTHWGYARYHQRPQPFLSRQLDQQEPRILDTYNAYNQSVLAGVRGT